MFIHSLKKAIEGKTAESDCLPPVPLEERKRMLERKLRNARDEHDFVKFCLKVRKDLLEAEVSEEAKKELEDHIADLREQHEMYEKYIRMLHNQKDLAERGETPDVETLEVLESNIAKFNRRLREKFGEYKLLGHLEERFWGKTRPRVQ